LNNSLYVGDEVSTMGIVTCATGVASGSRNTFIEMAQGGPWSGIMVYQTDLFVQMNEGDSVEVTGIVQEYYGNTEIYVSDAGDIVILDTGVPLPDVSIVPVGYLDTTASSSYDPDSAEAYEGVLVRCEEAYVTDTAGPSGDWEIWDGSGYCYVRDNGNYTYTPHMWDVVDVTGIVHVYYDLFRLQPRYDDDLDPRAFHVSYAFAVRDDSMEVIFTLPVDPVTGGDPGNFSLTGGLDVLAAERDAEDLLVVHLKTDPQAVGNEYTLYVENVEDTLGNPLPDVDSAAFWGGVMSIATIQSDTADSGLSAWEDRRVTTTGIVTCDSTSSSWWWLEMAQGGPFSGIQAYDYTYEPIIGDSVFTCGTIMEYYGMTEIGSIVYCEIVSSGNDSPPPETLVTGDLSYGAVDIERWESVLIQVVDAIVTNANPGGYDWEIDDGSGPCIVYYNDTYTYVPSDGDTVSVRGIVRYSYGNMQIEPRNNSDVVPSAVSEGAAGRNVWKPIRLNLMPNPMTEMGELHFVMPSEGDVQVAIYDASGRQVRELLHGTIEAGTYTLAVNPGLPSGVYFAGLKAGKQWKVRKFTVLGQ
jgi:DNA/RNA endonuclease YhcR with UshA esterase domain